MTIPLDSRRSAKPRQFRTPLRAPASRCSLALVANSSHSSLRVFRDLRTLSFFGSQLSPVLSPACALFRKKPGVRPYLVIPQLCIVDCRQSAAGQSRATSAISFTSPPYAHQPRISFVSPTYAKTGGGTPTQKCRRADIIDFSPDISHFFTPASRCRHHPAPRGRKKGWHESQRYIEEGRDLRRHRPLDSLSPLSTSRPLSVSARQYLAPIARDGAKTEPRGIPAWSGSPRCGYVPFEHRCPDAHD
jgi:hypothetical protein